MEEQRAFKFSRSRVSDPASSRRAERRMRDSGQMANHERIALEMIKQNPGRTSKELGMIGPLDRYQVARRLKELEAAKLIQRHEVGSEDARWYAL